MIVYDIDDPTVCAMIICSVCVSMPASLVLLWFYQISSLHNHHCPCFCDQCFCLLTHLFHWSFVHYSLPCFFDYYPILCIVLSVHVLGYLWMSHCLSCNYWLCMIVSHSVLMSSNGSVFAYFCSWSWRYCSTVACVGYIYCLSQVTSQPVLVMCML